MFTGSADASLRSLLPSDSLGSTATTVVLEPDSVLVFHAPSLALVVNWDDDWPEGEVPSTRLTTSAHAPLPVEVDDPSVELPEMLSPVPSTRTFCVLSFLTDALSHPLLGDTNVDANAGALADAAPVPNAAASPPELFFLGLVLLPLKLKSSMSSSSSVSASSAQLVTGDFFRNGDLSAATTLLDLTLVDADVASSPFADATESTTESTIAVTAAFVLGDGGVFPFFFLAASLPQAGLAASLPFFSRTGLLAVLATVAAHEKGAGALDVLIAVVVVVAMASPVSPRLGPEEAEEVSPLA